MNSVLLLAAALTTGDPSAAALDTSIDDPTDLQGTWEVLEVSMRGIDVSNFFAGKHWTFVGDLVEFRNPRGNVDRWRISAGTSRLDHWTDDGRSYLGVYAIAGDTLVWTWGENGCGRRYTFRRVRK
jgi:hypothetical protein